MMAKCTNSRNHANAHIWLMKKKNVAANSEAVFGDVTYFISYLKGPLHLMLVSEDISRT